MYHLKLCERCGATFASTSETTAHWCGDGAAITGNVSTTPTPPKAKLKYHPRATPLDIAKAWDLAGRCDGSMQAIEAAVVDAIDRSRPVTVDVETVKRELAQRWLGNVAGFVDPEKVALVNERDALRARVAELEAARDRSVDDLRASGRRIVSDDRWRQLRALERRIIDERAGRTPELMTDTMEEP